MIKFHFTFDKTKKSQSLKKKILKKYTNCSPKISDVIVVAGGDGFMLHSLKKYVKFKKPFYGINCGTYGFLMNRYVSQNLENKILKAKKTVINPLQVSSSNNKIYKKGLIAVNEISLFRQTKQTASLKLEIGKKTLIKKLIGDGVLISTPAGSTAYNLSVRGPILSLNSGKLAITPISPFRPRRWKGKTISNKVKIKLTNLDPKKRPVAAVADNIEIRNIKTLKIKANKNINLTLLYDPERSLVKRIKIEQIRRNFY
jgi:NAD+ kinase|tara:strand:- start:256 stop:1026 length:771 start_codon:yes stop_codon:yes gene_type:complete